MTPTTEQIREILEGAPDETNQYEECGKYWYVYEGSGIYLESPMHYLFDLREILTLRQRVEDDEVAIRALSLEVERLKAHLDKCTGLPASVGICEPVEGYAEEPYFLHSAVKGMASKIKQLEAQQSEVAARAVSRPMQPITKDKHGRDRFEENPIVSFLATEVLDLNKIAIWCIENNIDKKHEEQLAQLIGYSVDGYGTLSYVSDESYEHANQLRKGEGDD